MAQDAERVKDGHAQVEQRHVGPVFDDEVQCGRAVAGFAGNQIPTALDEGAHDAVAIDGMVVGDDDAQQPGVRAPFGGARVR